jgi:hypothetical protein
MPVELETVVDDTAEDIGLKASVAVNLRELVHAAGVQAMQEVFTEQILPAARAGSPVGGHLDPHPGKNRDSLEVTFRDKPDTGWISAWLSTHSGYGWLIEHGTSHNRRLTRMAKRLRHGRQVVEDRTPARPYIYPAMMEHVATIADRQREILESQ